MRIGVKAVVTIIHLGIVGIVGGAAAHAQTIRGSATIAGAGYHRGDAQEPPIPDPDAVVRSRDGRAPT